MTPTATRVDININTKGLLELERIVDPGDFRQLFISEMSDITSDENEESPSLVPLFLNQFN